MDNTQAKNLLNRYLNNQCNPEEIAQVESWYLNFKESKIETSPDLLQGELDEVERIIINHARPKQRRLWSGLTIAASVLMCIAGGYFLLSKSLESGQGKNNNIYVNDILPGGNKAYLTLSDGRKLALGKNLSASLLNDGGAVIEDTKSGLRYKSGGGATLSSMNTINTPRGGEYQLTLSDGTKVWLNSSSSLSYPAVFTRNAERKVTLTGEGYFEVSKDLRRPFLVETGNQQIRVLGTHFNINAFDSQSEIRTTLLEGAVRIEDLNGVLSSKKIAPGQQAIFSSSSLEIKSANIEQAMAWKNGYFRFEDEKIESIMKRLSRWYDVEVNYDGKLPQEGFNGKISKFNNISQVLNALESTKIVHFKVQGRRVTVIP